MSSEAQHQFEIQLGHLCNNRCVFCVSGQVSEWRQAGQIPAEAVIGRLDEAYASGARKVTVLGGEPSIQRSFFDVMKHAVDVGFEEIVFFTNGVMTHRKTFVERLLALGGNFVWRFSIQGGNAEAHDDVTKRRGSFDKIIQSLAHVREAGGRITVNMCVNTLSYESLVDFPELCERYGIEQLHIDQVRARDAGVRDDDYLRSIMARYSDMAPYFARMLEGFDTRLGEHYDVNVGNLPYCVLPEWAHKIHHDGEATMTVAVDGHTDLSDPWDKYEDKRSDKAHPAQCDGCVFKASCNGVFEKYAQFYGTEEFEAVSLDRLREIDGDAQRFFCYLVEPYSSQWIAAAAQAPGPWTLENYHRDTRQRIVALRFRHDSGEALRLELLPLNHRGGGPAFDATTDRFALRAPAPFRGAVADQVMLLSWSLAALTHGREDVEVTQPLEPRRYAARTLLAKAPDPIERIAKNAQRRGEVAGMRFIGARRLEEPGAVALYFRGQGEQVIAATLRPAPPEAAERAPQMRVVGAPDNETATQLRSSLAALHA